jgi:hypothetical protein
MPPQNEVEICGRPIDFAAALGHVNCVCVLIEHGARIDLPGHEGRLPVTL